MRAIHPDTAQEWADDAQREAERAAGVAIADLRAELAQIQHELRVAQRRVVALEPVEAAIAALTARNPRIAFLPGPGPARLILGTTTIQGLGADAFLRACAALARAITPDPTDTP